MQDCFVRTEEFRSVVPWLSATLPVSFAALEQEAMAEQVPSDWLGLSGRVCVVTGGGGGIGRATALSFAQAGGRVAAIDLDERGLEVTRAELAQARRRACHRPLRHVDVESVTAASETIEKSLGPCQRAGQHRRGAASRRARHAVACRVERGSRGQPDRLLRLRAGFRPADARASAAAAWFMWPRSPAAMRRGRAAPTASARPA